MSFKKHRSNPSNMAYIKINRIGIFINIMRKYGYCIYTYRYLYSIYVMVKSLLLFSRYSLQIPRLHISEIKMYKKCILYNRIFISLWRPCIRVGTYYSLNYPLKYFNLLTIVIFQQLILQNNKNIEASAETAVGGVIYKEIKIYWNNCKL